MLFPLVAVNFCPVLQLKLCGHGAEP